jgi:hypothetical protein
MVGGIASHNKGQKPSILLSEYVVVGILVGMLPGFSILTLFRDVSFIHFLS